MLGKEKEDLKIETEEEVPVHLLRKIKEGTFLKLSVSGVISLVTLPVVAP